MIFYYTAFFIKKPEPKSSSLLNIKNFIKNEKSNILELQLKPLKKSANKKKVSQMYSRKKVKKKKILFSTISGQ